ncbi:CinA family protein [bacterium]|nr:MAG: CinA family protein [bacterium]
MLNAIFEYLTINKLTISVAESCTGGGLGSLLSELPGSSKILLGGFIVYSNKAKKTLLNVNENTLKDYGAVSEQTAKELAYNCQKKLNSDYAISITGIAGPSGGSEKKPVGTVWIGIAERNKVTAYKYTFLNDREANRELSKYTALSILYRKLKYNIE